MIVYQIGHWSKHFENNKSRGLERCSYVCMPNKQDGLGLNRILARPDGTAILGVWVLILQACSRQKKRDGWLTEDGTRDGPAWSAEDMAFRWRRPLDEIATALDFLCSDKIGWMQKIAHKCPSDGTDTAPDGQKTFMRGKEEKEGRKGTATAGSDEIDEHLEEPGQRRDQKTDDEIFELGSRHTRWRVTDTESSDENRQTLIFLFRSHPELAKALAEGHHFQTGKKINVWELEDMIAEKLKPTSPEPAQVVAQRVIAKHGWEACNAVAKCGAVKNASDMLKAMIANGTIFDAVTEKFGAA